MQKKLLIIEDNEDVRENIMEILELSNYKVVGAENGKEGVKAAKSEIPDLIICDIMMPEMDGYEVLYMLGKDPNTNGIPFIFLTAKAEKEDFRHGMSLGADDYLTKPFDDMELLAAIEKRLERHDNLKTYRGTETELDHFLKSASQYANLEDLKKDRQERNFDRGEAIFREGDFPHYLYCIVKGKTKTYKISPDGKELILNISKEGDYLGYEALLQDRNHSEFAAALEEVTVTLIPRMDFEKLVFENKEVSREFIRMLSKNVIDKESELLDLAYNTVRKRVADRLLKLQETYEDQKKFKIARNDLASMVGTATESVIRILSEFKKEGTIKIESEGLEIVNTEALKAVRW
ncbi:MAG: response regulator [Cyclobacteriaceae bacterium]|nr:response regulator [Cyclobacteriaceae bacterium HetDA_MAG_MS6]